MAETRKLAAIMAVDVVGYSLLMGEDETGTALCVREHRDAARPLIAASGGRVVKTMGDGLLLEFSSVVAAVECAIATQRLMVERNAHTPKAKRIVYRIGVNLGDVLVEGDDILGEGVNIAARLEGICEPGGVTISSAAYDHVRGKIDADFIDLGEKALKNIARPVRVYAVNIGSGLASAALAVDAPTGQGPPRLSIVVLPFSNMSSDPEQDYFVDGVTESLTTDLSRIYGSFVISHSTAFTYKGKSFDVRQIGRELNVRYVLRGSIQRGGNQMRISVQLVEASTGAHLWAERFDKPLTDLFDTQDEIVARLAKTLDTQLAAAAAVSARRKANPDSMDLYFQGLAWHFKGITPGSLATARHFFERALALDPDNFWALEQVAALDTIFAVTFLPEDRAERLAAAEAAVTRALFLAPDNAIAHLCKGMIQMSTNRAALGIRECERALELDRNLANAHHRIGAAKILLGQAEYTEAHVAHALRLSPRDPFVYLWRSTAGSAKLWLGEEEQAIAWLRQSIEANGSYPWSHFYLAAALARLGLLPEARFEAQAGLAINPTFTVARFSASAVSDNQIYLAGQERLIEGMRKAGVP